MSDLRIVSFGNFTGQARRYLLVNSEKAIKLLAESCPYVMVADFMSFYISDKAVASMAEGWRHLEALYLCQSSITETQLEILAKNCVHLRVLNLSHCKNVNG
jgi:hypothetical protein